MRRVSAHWESRRGSPEDPGQTSKCPLGRESVKSFDYESEGTPTIA